MVETLLEMPLAVRLFIVFVVVVGLISPCCIRYLPCCSIPPASAASDVAVAGTRLQPRFGPCL